MGSPLGCLIGLVLAFFVFIGVFLLSLIGKVRDFLTMMNPQYRKKQQNNNRSQQNQTANTSSNPSHQKVFSDDEGEYVDYEEIK